MTQSVLFVLAWINAVACLPLVFVATLHAEIAIQPSIDMLVASADVICIGDVVSVQTRRVRKGVWVEKIGLKVTESIQLSLRGEVLFFAYEVSRSSITGREWLFAEKGVLVLLRSTSPAERLLDSTLTPVATRRPMTVIDFSRADQGLYFTNTFEVISDGQLIKRAVLAARNRRLEFQENANVQGQRQRVKSVQIAVPPDSEAHKALYADSAVYLVVPTYMQKRQH